MEVRGVAMLMPFVISGLVTGAIYGLAGVGLVLTYKTSGVFNFAHGALAALAAYLFYWLHVQNGMAWPLAALLAIVFGGGIAGFLFERLARVLAGESLAIKVAGTVGVLLVVESSALLIYGQIIPRIVPQYLPQGQVLVGGVNIQYSQIVTFVFAAAVTALLYTYLRTTRTGVAMRAVVEDPALLDIAGTSAVHVRRWSWVIGGTLAAASGVLFAPILPLDPVQLTLLVVQAFGAAAVAAFSSLPITFAAGLGIGVLSSLSTRYFSTGMLSGLPSAMPFIFLFAVLLVFPKRQFSRTARSVGFRAIAAHASSPGRWRIPSLVVTLAAFCFVPLFAGIYINNWTEALADILLMLSLGLLVRTAGQVSLSQVTFAAIGAVAFSRLTVDVGIPWLPALLLAGLIAVPIGALLAIPAIRLGGLYLALATLGFGIMVYYVFFQTSLMFGVFDVGLALPRPHVFGTTLSSNNGFYYLVLGLVGLLTAGIFAMQRSRLGRLLRGLAESPTALATSGVRVNVTRVLVFCMSAFIAAIAGALAGMAHERVSIDSYPLLGSLTYLVLVVIAVGPDPLYAVAPALAVALFPVYLTGATTPLWLEFLFGTFAVAFVFAHRIRLSPRRPRPAAVAEEAISEGPFGGLEDDDHIPIVARDGAASAAQPRGLEIRDVGVHFGGLVAVAGVSLEAPMGRITGLIGPNGAGKTTIFNACSGLVSPREGQVILHGRDIVRMETSARARLGLGRTFQQMQLLDSLSVRENVSLGVEAALAGNNPLAHVAESPRDRPRRIAETDAALALCGLTHLEDAPVGTLSVGVRRLVELARCLAGPFTVLLLDEPSSGLDQSETERFRQILLRVMRQRELAILLVEHDMRLVGALCDYLYVLDFGELIYEGPTAEVLASDVVRTAYLGRGFTDLEALEQVELTPEAGA